MNLIILLVCCSIGVLDSDTFDVSQTKFEKRFLGNLIVKSEKLKFLVDFVNSKNIMGRTTDDNTLQL